MNWTVFAGILLINTLIAISMAILLSRKRAVNHALNESKTNGRNKVTVFIVQQNTINEEIR